MFYSSIRQFLGLVVSLPLLWMSMGTFPARSATKPSDVNSPQFNYERESLIAQSRFRGFSGRYGAAPRRRGVAYRRGSCLPPQAQITALLPSEEVITNDRDQHNLGKDRTWYTAEAYPTIYFHAPENTAQKLEIVIEDQNRQIVYSAVAQLPQTEVSKENPRPQGFIGIDLSRQAQALEIPPLEAGTTYLWEINLICNDIDRSGNPLVSGWISRIDATETANLENAISTMENTQIPWFYAENGLWYSALNAFAQNYLAHGNTQDWINLLEDIGYNRIARDPLIGMAEVQEIFMGRLPEIEF
jgi:hypothetical protein